MKKFLTRRAFLALAILSVGAGGIGGSVGAAATASPSPHAAVQPQRTAAPGGVQTTSQTNDECTPPGLEILTDATGDATGGQAFHDIQSLSISEPEFMPTANKLVFTLKMAGLATLPPDTTWPVWFAPPAGTQRWVAMTTFPPATPTAPAFLYGTSATSPTVNVTAPDGNLDAESGYNVDGTIKLVISKSNLGVTTGDALTNFLVRIREEVVPGMAAVTPDNMPQNLAPAGSYTLVGNCNPTVVTVTSFRARSEQGRVAVTWQTADESRIFGFNVWRRGTRVEQKVNRTLVVARGALRGASYRLVDRTTRPGTTFTYRLQIVKRDGSTAWHGSARVRPAR